MAINRYFYFQSHGNFVDGILSAPMDSPAWVSPVLSQPSVFSCAWQICPKRSQKGCTEIVTARILSVTEWRVGRMLNSLKIDCDEAVMILIADDQKDAGTALGRLLRHAGHEAVCVTSGAEALAMLHVRKPDLMVLDVNMPEMDGLVVLQAIRDDPDLKDVRIVMYSADTHGEAMVEAKRLGALDYLVKGTTAIDKLVARLSKLADKPANTH